jgi:ComF family protein
VRQAVHQLKYQNLRALAAPLGDFLAEFLETSDIAADVIVPVPLHSKRLRERGYNQSALLARKLGKGAGLPVVEGCLERVKATLPQARTTAVAERQQNMAGAFACRSERLKDRRVLLVDDVATSGATLDAAAAALKAGGAASVWGLTLAREI